jgi:hypothetical protein
MDAINVAHPPTAASWKQPCVLLIDRDPSRQFERAASMRRCGVSVDCAADVRSAGDLWQPEKYRLVLIEMCDAEGDVTAFCLRLQQHSPPQKVGIYRSAPPYIVPPGDPLLLCADTARTVHRHAGDGVFAAGETRTVGLAHAAQRIRALKPRRAHHVAPAPPPDRLQPESQVSIASRLLGGTP